MDLYMHGRYVLSRVVIRCKARKHEEKRRKLSRLNIIQYLLLKYLERVFPLDVVCPFPGTILSRNLKDLSVKSAILYDEGRIQLPLRLFSYGGFVPYISYDYERNIYSKICSLYE